METNKRTLKDFTKDLFSDKKQTMRVLLFVIVFALAAVFVISALKLVFTEKEGLYEIENRYDPSVPYHLVGAKLKYRFTGSSGHIRSLRNDLNSDYNLLLKEYYQLLDVSNTYDDIANTALINKELGIRHKVCKELFDVLADAYAKTSENRGFDMFSGVMCNVRDSALYSDFPQDYDPLFSDYDTQMLTEWESIREKEDSVVFKLDEETSTVYFDISDEYKAFLVNYDLSDCHIIDFDRLHDAYLIQCLVTALEKKGYNDGYITTKSGITVLLSGFDGADICMFSDKYPKENGVSVVSAVKSGVRGKAYSLFHSFKLDEDEAGFYVLTKDGQKYYRSKYSYKLQNDSSVLCVLSSAGEFSAVEASYNNIILFESNGREAVLKNAFESKIDLLLELDEPEKRIYCVTTEGAALNTDYSFELYQLSADRAG